MKIGQLLVKLQVFFDFQDSGCHHFGFANVAFRLQFWLEMVIRHSFTKAGRMGHLFWELQPSFCFQDCGCRHLGFHEIQICHFFLYTVMPQSSLKRWVWSVRLSKSNDILFIFSLKPKRRKPRFGARRTRNPRFSYHVVEKSQSCAKKMIGRSVWAVRMKTK